MGKQNVTTRQTMCDYTTEWKGRVHGGRKAGARKMRVNIYHKGKFHPITGTEGPDGRRGITLLFL